MIVYHGTTLKIITPKIISSEIGRDFGAAFYTTDIREQAERWAMRKRRLMLNKDKSSKAVLNIYEWENSDLKDLNIKSYDAPDMDWLEMILQCRQDSMYKHGYDIVIGKVANDNVGETVSYVQQGIMRKEDAVERLKFEKINNQIAFCTEKSLSTLIFKESVVL